MARRHYANAIVARQNIAFDEWMEGHRAQHEGIVPASHVNRIAKQVLRNCDPKRFLLSHATIVASVDTFAPKGAKTGSQMNRGIQIDVRWPDFRIKPECHDIVNNNGDAWERALLLSTYRTFIGSQNYLEHIQIPELSKGFIVDAIARDLGRTCYIDILVATDRKHDKLIRDILSGEVSAMSMGCISLFTTCTKCGNVAVDDAQLCPCVAFEGKGSKFLDPDGQEHVIAELIGHVSVPNSNQFIEASWVGNPAFRGAVRRSILNPDSAAVAAQVLEAARVYQIRSSQPLPEGLAHAASTRRVAEEPAADEEPSEEESEALDEVGGEAGGDDLDLGGAPDGESGAEPAPGGSSADPMEEMLSKAQQMLLESIVQGLSDRLAPKPEDVMTAIPVGGRPTLDGLNDNMMRASIDPDIARTFSRNASMASWAHKARRAMRGGRAAIANSGLSSKDLIVLSWMEDRIASRESSPDLYRVAMAVGPSSNFPSQTSYLAACQIRMGRPLAPSEREFLCEKGKLASLA